MAPTLPGAPALLILAWPQLATAAEPPATEDLSPDAPAEASLLPADARAEAVDPGVISRRDLDRLEPKRSRLEQNPYTHTDFTAYSLEWGETRLGLATLRTGVLPRTQLGTLPVALAAGMPNAHAKVDFLRVGPFDLAATGSAFMFSHEDFQAQHWSAGSVASLRVMPRWSVHVGGRYQTTEAAGRPNLRGNPWILDLVAPDVAAQAQQAEDAGLADTNTLYDKAADEAASSLTAQVLTLKVASDVRINRRDSLILQAQANLWAESTNTIDTSQLPEEYAMAGEVLDNLGESGVLDTYVASAAWQFSWHRADLRLGVGVSSVPGAWLTQTADFAWRFGGPTRRDERKMARTWKSNKKDLRRATAKHAPAPDAI